MFDYALMQLITIECHLHFLYLLSELLDFLELIVFDKVYKMNAFETGQLDVLFGFFDLFLAGCFLFLSIDLRADSPQ